MDRRGFLASGLCAVAAPALAAERFDAIVSHDSRFAARGDRFSSIQSAIDAAPSEAGKPFRIFIGAGRWREKIAVEKPNVHFVGEHRQRTIVSFDAYAGQVAPDGQPYGTFRSATVTVKASQFAASNLTIENAFDHLKFLANVQGEPTGANRAQAVALMLDGQSDRALIENCDISGYQDTLFVNTGRTLIRRCRISGTVDFIFGAGRALIDSCEIVSRFRPNFSRVGVIAAPSTLIDSEYGLTFSHCRLIKEPSVPPSSVTLGRAWRPTTNFPDGRYGNPKAVGLAVYLQCWMNDHIAREGWDSMEYGAKDGSRVQLRPDDARLFEYASNGPGAAPSRKSLSKTEAQRYSARQILGDWSP